MECDSVLRDGQIRCSVDVWFSLIVFIDAHAEALVFVAHDEAILGDALLSCDLLTALPSSNTLDLLLD